MIRRKRQIVAVVGADEIVTDAQDFALGQEPPKRGREFPLDMPFTIGAEAVEAILDAVRGR